MYYLNKFIINLFAYLKSIENEKKEEIQNTQLPVYIQVNFLFYFFFLNYYWT